MNAAANVVVPTSAAETTPAPSYKEMGVFSLLTLGLRLLPTLVTGFFNFAPVGGFAVFAGARMRSWLVYLLPVAIMFGADVILFLVKGELYAPWHLSQPAVYISYVGYVVLGRLLSKYGLLGLGGAAVLGSVQFYLVTNFASWIELAQIGRYPLTLEGLMMSYEAGLPFYRNTFASDLVFPFVFLGLHLLWQRYVEPALAPAKVES